MSWANHRLVKSDRKSLITVMQIQNTIIMSKKKGKLKVWTATHISGDEKRENVVIASKKRIAEAG
jgi:hypothetical protein